MKEIWKDIEGYEGFYQVSNFGRVKSLERFSAHKHLISERILKENNLGTGGYKSVMLYKNGVVKRFTVHRLVALAFIPNPKNLPQVGHKDENNTNNHVTNLEWVTPKQNSNMPLHKERISQKMKNKSPSKETRRKMSESHKGGKSSTAKKVICDGKIYECATYCANYYNVKSRTLRSWLLGDRKMPEKFIELGLSYYEEE